MKTLTAPGRPNLPGWAAPPTTPGQTTNPPKQEPSKTPRPEGQYEMYLGGPPVHYWLVEEIVQEPNGGEQVHNRVAVIASDAMSAFIMAELSLFGMDASDGNNEVSGFAFSYTELRKIDKDYRWAASDGSMICYEVRKLPFPVTVIEDLEKLKEYVRRQKAWRESLGRVEDPANYQDGPCGDR